MSTKASTAALRRIGQRLLLLPQRVPRHPASGQTPSAASRRCLRDLCRRAAAVALLFTFVFLVPAIASMSRRPFPKVGVPRIDSRAMETVHRKINEGNEVSAEFEQAS